MTNEQHTRHIIQNEDIKRKNFLKLCSWKEKKNIERRCYIRRRFAI